MRMVNKKLAVLLSAVVIVVICSVSAPALPPDPDNAALLYYQAFLQQEKTNESKMLDMIRPLAKGQIDPNDKILKYIESNRSLMGLVETAANLDQCDWGIKYSDGFEVLIPHFSPLRKLFFLFIADARVLAGKGDYESGIDRCLTVYKMGNHVSQGQTLISIIVGFSSNQLANDCIRDILSNAKVDLETLQWLKAELETVKGRFVPLKTSLEFEHEIIAGYFNMERIHELIPLLEEWGSDGPIAKAALESIPAADEKFCKRNKEYLDKYFEAVIAAMDLPYQEASVKLADLSEQPKKDFDNKNPDALLTCVFAPSFSKCRHYEVQRNTALNAVGAAIEIYMIKAATGQLPDSLAASLPKDEFSGEDFGYRKTDDGFVLATKGREIRNGKMLEEPLEYKFNVVK